MSKHLDVGGLASANVPRAALQASSVRILGKRPVPPCSREIDLYYSANGQRLKQRLVITRPTSFEEISVALLDGISPLPPPDLYIPIGLHDFARQGRRVMRELTSRLSPTYRSSSPMLDTRHIEPNNISLLLVDCIPIALYARDVLGGDLVTVFRKVEGPFRAILDELGIETAHTPKRLEGRIVHVRGSRRLQVYDLLGMPDCPALSFFPATYDRFTFPYAGSPAKIYLARRGVRAVLNNAEVERILHARGYESIYMEDFSVRDQMAIAQHAKHVVAVHGAAMALLALNRQVASLLELFPPHTYHEHFANALPRVDKFSVLLPDFDESVPSHGWDAVRAFKDAPFTVDLEGLERALDDLQSGSLQA